MECLGHPSVEERYRWRGRHQAAADRVRNQGRSRKQRPKQQQEPQAWQTTDPSGCLLDTLWGAGTSPWCLAMVGRLTYHRVGESCFLNMGVRKGGGEFKQLVFLEHLLCARCSLNYLHASSLCPPSKVLCTGTIVLLLLQFKKRRQERFSKLWN